MSTWIHVYGWRQGAAGQGGKRGCVCGKGKETGIGTEGASGSVVSVGIYEAVNDGLGDFYVVYGGPCRRAALSNVRRVA